ncbi:response regulator [Thermodesulforhabdus norvegica]|uniref:PatA-like N-terminal domain-containing protein n=1 Tax=Thermodesulforhabdus norvegica TaxID=39841 RepID=A0A1I4TGN4_9BACT|nr:response regulator [Thermodesulforhabdus norvegica]SFM75864.1 protein of unknown function [Thermodesulforhabdus norvegica]
MQGFRGTLAGVSLLDLIQFLCTSGAEVRLQVSSPDGEGIICIGDGRVFHAETARHEGEEAFFEIALWKQGEFRWTPLAGEWRNRVTIDSDWQYLILEASRIRDETVTGRTARDEERDYIVAYCQKCQKRFYVPADKVPFGKKVRVKCPGCREEVIVEREEAVADVFEREIEKWKYEELEEGPDFLEISGGVLVCTGDVELGKSLSGALQREGYQVHLVNRGRDGFFALRQGDFSVVIIDEALDGGGLDRNILLHYLQRLPMNIRRKFYVCLLGQELRTRDFWAAFRLGVDLVVNKNNVDLIGELLHYTTVRLRKFYEPFLEELQILKAE